MTRRELNIKSKMAVAFGVTLLLIICTGIFSWSSTVKLVDNAELVAHTHEVLVSLESIVSQLKDAETGQRGFVITGEAHYLEPYYAGLEGVDLAVADVRKLTLDNPFQQARLDVLDRLLQRKLDELSQTIKLRRDVGFESALEVIVTDAGQHIMDQLRTVIGQMEQEERRLLEQRGAATASTATKTKFAVIVGTVVSTAIFGIITIFLSWTNSKLEYEVQERKQAEKAVRRANLDLEDLNRTLEVRVQERTRDLEEAKGQLIRSEKLAAIGQLSGGVAHDLCSPLGAINNAVYYLKRRLGAGESVESNPRIGQFLQIIEEQVQHSNEIITDLLDFAHTGQLSVAPINLANLVEDALSTINSNENVQLNLELDPELPQILADPDQIKRVLVNLAWNAHDAMPEGGQVTIATHGVDGFAELTVTDTGVGITDENLQKIFDPLFTTKTKGTGLGLAICQQIVSRHQGTISVVSSLGKGTTFTVRLPLAGEGDMSQPAISG